MVNADTVVSNWNAQADEFNQWDMLSDEEKIDFAIAQTAERCAEIADNQKYFHNSPHEYESACLDVFDEIAKEFNLPKAG